MFNPGQLCKIVDDPYKSNLPDNKITYCGILVSEMPLTTFKMKRIPQGTIVLVVQRLEKNIVGLIGDKLYFIDIDALENI